MNEDELIAAKAKAMDLLMNFAEDFATDEVKGLERTDQFIEVYKKIKAEAAALEAENQRLREALSVTLSTIQSREDHYKFCIWCGDLTYPKHDCELMQMRDELAAALNTGDKP